MESTFIYGHQGCHIDYKGMGFDSLLELRYAISIEEEYAYARECVKIYYDPLSAKSTFYLKQGTKSYKPDFLIRHHNTRKAFLVEVKPRGFDDFDLLARYQSICKYFIATSEYDWEYKIVFEEEIMLTTAQQELYDAVLSNKILYRNHYECYSLDHRKITQSRHVTPKELLLYLKRNKLPQHYNF
ncbi:MAG TPA: hypothetical protein VG738_18675 [Chitinophagaceae bacterium]|nr:hypothetical protein [Chitinophagaceae bacterium]